MRGQDFDVGSARRVIAWAVAVGEGCVGRASRPVVAPPPATTPAPVPKAGTGASSTGFATDACCTPPGVADGADAGDDGRSRSTDGLAAATGRSGALWAPSSSPTTTGVVTTPGPVGVSDGSAETGVDEGGEGSGAMGGETGEVVGVSAGGGVTTGRAGRKPSGSR